VVQTFACTGAKARTACACTHCQGSASPPRVWIQPDQLRYRHARGSDSEASPPPETDYLRPWSTPKGDMFVTLVRGEVLVWSCSTPLDSRVLCILQPPLWHSVDFSTCFTSRSTGGCVAG